MDPTPQPPLPDETLTSRAATVTAYACLTLGVTATLFGAYAIGEFILGPRGSFSEIGLYVGIPALIGGLLTGIPMMRFLRRRDRADYNSGRAGAVLIGLAMLIYLGILLIFTVGI